MWTGTGDHNNDDGYHGDDDDRDHEDNIDIDDNGKNVGVDNDNHDSNDNDDDDVGSKCSFRVNEKIEEEYRKEREAKTSPSKSKKPARH